MPDSAVHGTRGVDEPRKGQIQAIKQVSESMRDFLKRQGCAMSIDTMRFVESPPKLEDSI